MLAEGRENPASPLRSGVCPKLIIWGARSALSAPGVSRTPAFFFIPSLAAKR